MALQPEDYIRLLDCDLADATKAYKTAERLLLRSRLRLVHLSGAIRDAQLRTALVSTGRLRQSFPAGPTFDLPAGPRKKGRKYRGKKTT